MTPPSQFERVAKVAEVAWLNHNVILFDGKMWCRSKTRRSFLCRLSKTNIRKGEMAWRPLSNGGDRMYRISDEYLNKTFPRA